MSHHYSPGRSLGVEALESRNLPSNATFAVAIGILKSPEEFNHFVKREYEHLLLRAPDSGGLTHFVTELQNGTTRETVEAELASSQEYAIIKGTTLSSYVTNLYVDLLGRNPNSIELNFWVTALSRGTSPFTVAKKIGTSLEHDVQLIQSNYQEFLGRSASPSELFSWLTKFLNGADRTKVEASIVASDEFFADANRDPSTFIIHIYQDVFVRTPVQTEVTFWLNVYNQNNH